MRMRQAIKIQTTPPDCGKGEEGRSDTGNQIFLLVGPRDQVAVYFLIAIHCRDQGSLARYLAS